MTAAHEAAERAIELGGAGTVAVVEVSSEADLRWANSMLTTNGERVSTTLTVLRTRGVAGGVAAGTASGPVRNDGDIAALVQRADAAARDGSPAPDAQPLVVGDASPEWADAIPLTSSEVFAGVALELGEAFARGRGDGVEHFGYAEHEVSTVLVASSTGLRARHTQPTGRIEATAKSHQRTRSSWAGRAGRDLAGVRVADLDAELRQGLQWQGRSIDLEPGRHPVILTPSAVADLMVYLYWTASARDAADGRTVFSRAGGGTRVGDRLAGGLLSLTSDPGDPELACEPFASAPWSSSMTSAFDLGLPLGPTAWVDRGSLAHLVTTRHSASELAAPTTPVIDNLRVTAEGATGSVADVVARTERGVLVTCLWYIREVDPRTLLLTGLTRDGVYLVENGEVVGTVGNYRFNMSPVDVLAQAADAGATVPTLAREFGDYFTRAAAPALTVEGFNLSTRSDAL